MAREGSPAVAGAAAAKPKSKSAKRKASSESPLRDVAPPTASPAPSSLGTKRKTTEDTPPVSAGASPADGAAAKKKKKSRASTGSATPQPGTPTATTLSIPTTEEVLAWLRSQPDPDNILQQAAANNFLDRLRGPDMSQRLKLFLSYIRSYTSQPSSGILALRPEYRS
jgi:hypothetical protein